MGKAFGLLVIVGLLWVGLEIYNEGTEEAFGGAFASIDSESTESDGEPRLTVPGRAGRAVERARQTADERLERQLGEGY